MPKGNQFADGKHLGRDPLLKKVMEKLQDSQFVVISSPPASGKTSLLTFFELKEAPDPFYVFLDDAQKIYDDSEFWEQLIIASKISTAKNFTFAIFKVCPFYGCDKRKNNEKTLVNQLIDNSCC
eukprot:TRINITY_DN7206_c0_g1_i9.p1 TRINITY_DN7206_c0_g1~~TRINITY_DN7206_c0_g1_i9.p1  ORF type:complete len:124 (+),score=36.00 TRINITY_DN7206_c0_g1_i9:908-1279(+)